MCCEMTVSPGNCGSHTARSGQEPLTLGGTKSAFEVGGKPWENRGSHTVRLQCAQHRRGVSTSAHCAHGFHPEQQISGHADSIPSVRRSATLPWTTQDAVPAPVVECIAQVPVAPAPVVEYITSASRRYAAPAEYIALAPGMCPALRPRVHCALKLLFVDYG